MTNWTVVSSTASSLLVKVRSNCVFTLCFCRDGINLCSFSPIRRTFSTKGGMMGRYTVYLSTTTAMETQRITLCNLFYFLAACLESDLPGHTWLDYQIFLGTVDSKLTFLDYDLKSHFVITFSWGTKEMCIICFGHYHWSSTVSIVLQRLTWIYSLGVPWVGIYSKRCANE